MKRVKPLPTTEAYLRREMRTCKFFSPSQITITNAPGTEVRENYEFDRPFQFSSCGCPAVTQGAPFAPCNFDIEQSACSFYEEEQLRPIKTVELTREDAEIPLLRTQRIELLTRRKEAGFPEYQIVIRELANSDEGTYGEARVLHKVSTVVHGPKAKEMAEALFDTEVREERSNYTFEDLPLLGEQIPYIETVVTC